MEFGRNERVFFHFEKIGNKYKATAEEGYDFSIEKDTLKELKTWLCINVPNYRSDEHLISESN